MPEGMRCSTVFLPAMTSVWPALWPPWKRTTPWARSVSQSTILPLPSSPHWVPMTTTLLAVICACSLSFLAAVRLQRGQGAQVAGASCSVARPADRLADLVVAPAACDWLRGAALRVRRIRFEHRARGVVVGSQLG